MTETTDLLALAEASLLAPSGLSSGDLERVMGHLLGPGIDTADIFLQATRHESWGLEDGIVKEGSHSIDRGVGIRGISGEKTGFAYSDEITDAALLEAATSARSITRGGETATHAIKGHVAPSRLYLPIDPIDSLSEPDKIELLRRLDAECRALDPRVEQVFVSLSGSHEVILVMNQEGQLQADVRPLVRLNVSVIVFDGQPGTGKLRRRWPHRLSVLPRGESRLGVCPGSCASGAGQSRSRRSARGQHDRGLGFGMARDSPA